MYLNYNSNDTFVSTGGKNIELNKPTICFVHGAGQNHFSFTQQIRYFANRGYNVLSPDFPGHGFSKGIPNSSIEEDAKWLLGVLEKIGKASEDPYKAYDLMVTWGHGNQGSFSISEWPGHHHLSEGNSVMKINEMSALVNDLNSCNDYEGGLSAAEKINIDCLAVLARFDIMTPLKAGKKLVNAIKNCESHVLNCGHFLPAEKPKELNRIILQYLKNLDE